MNRLLTVVIGLLLADIAITGLFFNLEANHIAAYTGLITFLAIKATMILPFAAVYVRYRPAMPRRADTFAGFIGVLYGLAVASNLWVLLA